MFRARLTLAVLFGCLAVLPASPAIAHAQLGGLVNRARQAARADKSQQQPTRNNLVAITNANVTAYVRGNKAEHAEIQRLDSLRALAEGTPASARMVAVARCQSKSMAANAESPAEMHADSVRAMKQFADLDTAKMRKLALQAQAGNTAALAELQSMSMQHARAQMADPEAIAARKKMQLRLEAAVTSSAACEKSVPAVASFAEPIASAKREIAKYGSESSPQYGAHLSSVKLAAAGGMSPAEYAILEERIRGYAGSQSEPKQGFSAAELAVLRAHRTELSALTY